MVLQHMDLGKYVANLSSLEFCDQDLLVEGGFLIGSRTPVPFVYACPLVAVRALCDPYMRDPITNPKRRRELHAIWKAYDQSDKGRADRARYMQGKERRL